MVFGGESALEKRILNRKKVDPRFNASPSSGNAITPLEKVVYIDPFSMEQQSESELSTQQKAKSLN